MFYDFIIKTLIFFVQKRLREAFALQTFLSSFLRKNIGIFQILTFKFLYEMLTNDIISLNNRTQCDVVVLFCHFYSIFIENPVSNNVDPDQTPNNHFYERDFIQLVDTLGVVLYILERSFIKSSYCIPLLHF